MAERPRGVTVPLHNLIHGVSMCSPVSGSETASLQKVVLSKPIWNAILHWRLRAPLNCRSGFDSFSNERP